MLGALILAAVILLCDPTCHVVEPTAAPTGTPTAAASIKPTPIPPTPAPTPPAGSWPVSDATEVPMNNRVAEFMGGSHFNLHDSSMDYDYTMPPSGVVVDGAGVGMLPAGVWTGSAGVAVSQNQLIQPPAYYPDWPRSAWVLTPNPPAWLSNQIYPVDYIIKPVNNNAGAFYFRVQSPPSASAGPGASGETEPTWNQIVGGTTDDFNSLNGVAPASCGTTGVCGVRWTNIGTYLPIYTIVPRTGNPGKYAYKPVGPTVGGQTGSVAPLWPQAPGQTVVDNGVVWKNVGVYQPNPSHWVFKATTGGTTAASMPALNQTLSGTTTDGGVTWTTTLIGTNTSYVDMSWDNPINAFGGGGLAPTTPPVVLLDQSSPAGSAPSISFVCKLCNATTSTQQPMDPFANVFNQSLVIDSNDGGLAGSWYRFLKVNGRQAVLSGNSQPQTDMLRFSNHQLPDTQRSDLAGKVNAYGQFNVVSPPQPSNSAMVCNVPAWTASILYADKFTIRPTSGNAGNYFFQNQGGATCTAGSTQPAAWDQTPGNTTADNTCTWTNIDNGAGVASAGAAGTYYGKYTWRVGALGTLQQETLPNSVEQTVACGPTDAQNSANVSLSPSQVGALGADTAGFYVSTTAGTETLVELSPFGSDVGSILRAPLSRIPPVDWSASTMFYAWQLLKPGVGNVGNFYYVATKSGGVTGAARPAPFNQTVGGTTADGSETWLNVGTGALPTVSSTGLSTFTGIKNANGLQGNVVTSNPAAATITLELSAGTLFSSTVSTTGGTTTIANPNCLGVACGALDIGREFEIKILCNNGAGCDTLAFGVNFKTDASATIPANTKIRTCRFRIVGATEIDQVGGCSADM